SGGTSASTSAPVVLKAPTASDAHASDNVSAASTSSSIAWAVPAQGKVADTFGHSGIEGKGIVIHGKVGEPVVASATGTVVYAGSALTGYGRLVIVKHNNTWLSAYGHNHTLLVDEGDHVERGEKIATMGRG